VGVIVESTNEGEMGAAYDRLCALLRDPGLAARCRRAAEAVFSLEAGTEAYREIYHAVMNGRADPVTKAG